MTVPPDPPRAVASFPGQPRINAERKRGAVLLAGAIVASGAWAGLLAVLARADIVHNPRIYKILGFPFAIAVIAALVGLAKLIFGRTLGELARSWDQIAGWQRFIAGVVIVAIAVVAIIALAGVAITLLA